MDYNRTLAQLYGKSVLIIVILVRQQLKTGQYKWFWFEIGYAKILSKQKAIKKQNQMGYFKIICE